MTGDTIYAVASGRPPAAIAILRLSGPHALQIGKALAGSLPAPGEARLRALRDPADGALLDRALLLVFHAPASATGEDVVEFHLHGGRAVVAAVERAVAAQRGTRAAEPGEFTRRALMAGRMDLAEAEGLADLLSAETELQRRAALMAAEGQVSRAVRGWATRIVALSARIEATIDFAEEDDIAADEVSLAAIRRETALLAAEISQAIAAPPVERLRDGIRVVLAGPVNAGKSSLLNALAARDAAIVSPLAGTTRDRVEVPVSRNGVPYVLVDTAGLRASVDPIESIGIARAQEAIATADLVLWLDDLPPAPELPAIAIYPRADLPDRGEPGDRLSVSALSGEGVEQLWDEIERRALRLLPISELPPFNGRQQELCAEAANRLSAVAAIDDPLLVAEDVRAARVALDHITGVAGTDDLLDAIFSRFCLGK